MILPTIASVVAFVGSVDGGRTQCAICLDGVEIEFCHSVQWEARVINCENVVSVSGVAAGVAVGTFSDLGAGSDSCPPHDNWYVSFDSGFLGDPNADGGAVVDGFLAIAGSGSGGCGCDFAHIVDFAGVTMNPYCYLRSSSSGSIYMNSYNVKSEISYENIGYGTYLETCTAGVSSAITIQTSGPLQIETEISVDASNDFEVYFGCSESEFRNSNDVDVTYVGVVSTFVVRDSVGNTIFLHRGIIANDSEGNVLLLGVYDDEDIVLGTGTGGETTVTGGLLLESGIPGAGTYTLDLVETQFGSTAGDYNGDGDVSPADEDAVLASLGSSLNDFEYLAGVDVDLDGIITQAEVDRALSIISKLIGSCSADLNQDGVQNFFDIALFLSYMQNSDPIADWNQDGLINFFDLSLYMNDFNSGC